MVNSSQNSNTSEGVMNNHLVDLLMVQRPRGTRDFTPQVMNRRLAFEQLLEKIARRSGFNRVQTPVFEF